MHRSRPFVLVLLAAAAACSQHDPTEGNDLLSQDRALAARIGSAGDLRQPSLPNACGTVTVAAAPSAANEQQADELTRQAGVAEMHGNIDSARSLLSRASALDSTNKSAAYHLGRTSEALGDRAGAMSAYCRYLALAPTAAESVEARQRVSDLARSLPSGTTRVSGSVGVRPSVAARSPVAATTTRRMTRLSSTMKSRVATNPPVRSSESEPVESPAPATTPTGGGGTHGTRTAGGDVVTTSLPAATPESAPAPAPRRTSIGVQSAVIGAAAGAILGAATGRSVRSTVIGAAAGGVLGTVVGTTTRPGRRGIRS